MYYFLVLNPFLIFLNGKILSVRFLLTHPVYIYMKPCLWCPPFFWSAILLRPSCTIAVLFFLEKRRLFFFWLAGILHAQQHLHRRAQRIRRLLREPPRSAGPLDHAPRRPAPLGQRHHRRRRRRPAGATRGAGCHPRRPPPLHREGPPHQGRCGPPQGM